MTLALAQVIRYLAQGSLGNFREDHNMQPEAIAKSLILAIGVLVALVGVADIWLSVRFSADASITSTVRQLATNYPSIPFAVGVLMGHLFW